MQRTSQKKTNDDADDDAFTNELKGGAEDQERR